MPRVAIYPGSFDPVTNGHIDIIERGLKLFDKIIVSILHNPGKNNLFTLEERLEMLKDCMKKFKNIEIDSFDGLLVDYAADRKAHAILRGLRAMSDFEYEFQMAQINKKLCSSIETMFLVTDPRYAYLSSSAVKEVARFGGSIKGLVPEEIEPDIVKSFANNIFD